MVKRVLVAEDEKSIRELVVFNLKRNGYEAVEAENGSAALKERSTMVCPAVTEDGIAQAFEQLKLI